MTKQPIIRPAIRPLLVALAALALAAPAVAPAAEQSVTTPASPPAETTSTPVPAAPTAPAPTSTTEAPPTPSSGVGAEAPAPQVQAQHAQGSTAGGSPTASHAHLKAQTPAGSGQPEPNGGSSPATGRALRPAPAPSALTPPLPLTFGSPISGVPGFYIESFRIPPFLLPIFQAAGSAYGIPWQVLAAINEVETDYGRDLSVSSAGAEGWMQFLPSSWETYGVDANGDGFKDPYNPADAIFAAARYLKAAGGDTDIRGAVYSYNHSQAYVASVLLRAQLLGGTPPNLLGAITGLTQARFPVHAPSHFSDGFQTVMETPPAPTPPAGAPKAIVGTTIYSQQGAPVIAVGDGQILGFGHTRSLGRYVSLRDSFGNTYTYAELGSVAKLYPVLVPHAHAGASAQAQQAGPSGEPAPLAPASAGTQSRAPLSEGAAGTGLQLGVGSGLEVPAAGAAPASDAPPAVGAGGVPILHAPAPRVIHLASEDVYLHPLIAGAQVLAGTVLGHVGPATSTQGSLSAPGPHMLFQIRPAGAGAPLIDPKPVLDGWVALENTSIFRAKGANPFPRNAPAAGQVLLESKQQLSQQVLGDTGIHLSACGRHDVQTGQVGRRVLAMLEFLSVSALRPAVSSLQCSRGSGATAANAAESTAGDTVEITAVNGMAIADRSDPARPSSIAEVTIRKLLGLQGTMKPSQIAGPVSYPGAPSTLAARRRGDSIHVAFAPLEGEPRPGGRGPNPKGKARSAGIFSAAITPGQWVQLIARLGEIPNPKVGSGPSAAAVPDHPGAPRAATPPPGREGK